MAVKGSCEKGGAGKDWEVMGRSCRNAEECGWKIEKQGWHRNGTKRGKYKHKHAV